MTTQTRPVQIVTDGTSDLPPEIAASLGISVVPLYVHFGEESFRPGIDLTSEEFYERLTSGRSYPRTSQPAPADFEAVYAKAASEGPVVSLHVSKKVSGTYNSALLGREEVLRHHPGASIEVIDSEHVSMMLGLLAMGAAERARQGATVEEVVAWVRGAIPRARTIFVLDTLEYLAKGGRLGRGQAFLGGLLSVKPLLAIREGEVHPLERTRTRMKALDRLTQLALAEMPVERLAVAGSGDMLGAIQVSERLREALGHESVPVFNIGPVIGTYAGPGCVGVGILKRGDPTE
ncbi:MAG: DegV family protein [Chloroflexi bacterium]|nr:DegV family protein [Chloroflexota bacterium]